MLKILSNRIDTGKIFQLQNLQYNEILVMSDTVPASTEKPGKASVSNLGHFYCLFMTGSFTTLKTGPADDAISHLRGLLEDGQGKRLFNDYAPLDLFLTPGRRKDAADLTGAASNNLFIPIPFEYLFSANTDITLKVKNDAAYANSYTILFHGIRVKSAEADPNIPQMRR
jgi:hypothetical protein